MKIILLLTLIGLPLVSFTKEPSSAIPNKREFPLSTQYKPCDDFHKYVCDEAEKSFKLREDRSHHTFAFNDSAERLLDAKKKFFANINKEKNLSPRGLQVKNYYLACMNENAGKKQEVAFIKNLVSEIKNLKSIQEFADFQIRNIAEGKYSFVWFDINANQDQPKVNDLLMGSQLMQLPERSYYYDKALVKDYIQLIADYFRIVLPQISEKESLAKAERIFAFEKEFAEAYPLPEVQRQRWAERRQQTQEAFLKAYPHLRSEALFKQSPEKTVVFNAFPESFDFLEKKFKPENLDLLKDYALFAFGYEKLDDSQPEYFKKWFQFRHKYLGGPPQRSERQERCTRWVMGSFQRELDQILVDRLFPHFPEKKFIQVAEKIRSSIIDGLKNNTWLEPETKAKAILKIEKAKLYLIKPRTEREWNFTPIKKYSNTNKIDNGILLNKAQFEKKVKELKEGVNQEAWWMGPLTVNAYYEPSANKFVMPMGILQYPFFNAEGDLIENLGAVGAVIGHELGHGVDDQGARYDENGKVNQWMTMKDLAEFSNRGKKLIEYFNKAGHNGSLTLGENIGDLVGLTFAYNAAFPKGSTPKAEDQKKLFVAYARVWCEVVRPKAQEEQLKTNPHSLGWARINEQVIHQKAFADAFQCKKGDKMFLPDEDRVRIW